MSLRAFQSLVAGGGGGLSLSSSSSQAGSLQAGSASSSSQRGFQQQQSSATTSASMLEMQFKIMRARQANTLMKQELAKRIINEKQQQQQQEEEATRPPPSSGNADVIMDRISFLESMMKTLESKREKTPPPLVPAVEKKTLPVPSATAAAPPPTPPPPSAPKPSSRPPSVAVAPVREAPIVPIAPDTKKAMAALALKMSAAVEEHEKLLRSSSMPGLNAEEQEEQREENQKKEVAKKRIKSLLERKPTGRVELKTLWRHKLDGLTDPPASKILKGCALFRVLAKSIIAMYIRPQLAIRKRKIAFRDREAKDLNQTLILYSEAVSMWLGKIVRIPINSLEQDESLDFEPLATGSGGASGFKQRMLQLKVRVKSIVSSLATSEMPPDHITQFFITLIDEDNYFVPTFLWPTEKDILSFSDLGGTRGMLVPAADQNIRSPLKPRGEHHLGVAPNVRKVDATRARYLLVNFVFVRMLLNHCILSPWHYGVSRMPSARNTSKVVANCRILASVFYLVLARMDKRLPKLVAPPPLPSPSSSTPSTATASSPAATSGGGGGAHAADDDETRRKLIEQSLIYNRPPFEQIDVIISYLRPASDFAGGAASADSNKLGINEDFILPLARQLDQYANRLLQHVLEAREIKKGPPELEAMENRRVDAGSAVTGAPAAATQPPPATGTGRRSAAGRRPGTASKLLRPPTAIGASSGGSNAAAIAALNA